MSTTYTEEEAETAPRGQVRFPHTDVDVVSYRINATFPIRDLRAAHAEVQRLLGE